jgi:hypothetical protein
MLLRPRFRHAERLLPLGAWKRGAELFCTILIQLPIQLQNGESEFLEPGHLIGPANLNGNGHRQRRPGRGIDCITKTRLDSQGIDTMPCSYIIFITDNHLKYNFTADTFQSSIPCTGNQTSPQYVDWFQLCRQPLGNHLCISLPSARRSTICRIKDMNVRITFNHNSAKENTYISARNDGGFSAPE